MLKSIFTWEIFTYVVHIMEDIIANNRMVVSPLHNIFQTLILV